jgi:UDP-glucose 4-epimerase
MRTLRAQGREAAGIDRLASPFTDRVGSIADPAFVQEAMRGAGAVLHAATLHKPHVATHTRQEFVDTNITGTLNLLAAAVAEGVCAFVFTSTTSAFGDALTPPAGAPAAWIDEDVVPVPKNIYGVTKTAAEDLCRLFQRRERLPCVVLRTSRFFPEPDDSAARRSDYDDQNLKANEFLHRRVDVADIVDAHLLAIERAPAIGFGRYILSATTPFAREDAAELRSAAAAVVLCRAPGWEDEYQRRGFRMFASLDRVYDNARARRDLGWQPQADFSEAVARLRRGQNVLGPLAEQIGAKGYHAVSYKDGIYPVD